jgi:uncharacterized membrane protein
MQNAIPPKAIESAAPILPFKMETTPNSSVGAAIGQAYIPITAIPTAATAAILNLIDQVNSIFVFLIGRRGKLT